MLRKTCMLQLVIIVLLIIVFAGCEDSEDTVTPDIILTPSPSITVPDMSETEDVSIITPVDDVQLPSRGYFKGFASLLPPDGDFEATYQRAAEHAEFTNTWVGAEEVGYWNLADWIGGGWGDIIIGDLTRGSDLFPIINLTFIDKDHVTGQLFLKTPQKADYSTLSDPEFREVYKQGALNAVKATKPLYFSVGNEVNRWYEQYGAEDDDPNGFQHFVSLYEEIYDEVKELSPDTIVFCIFAREIVGEYREVDLEVLKMFNPEKLDILAFTSYPFAVQGINSPADMPDDYYSSAFNHFKDDDKPFGFTEISWSTLDDFGGEEAQAEFLNDAAGRLTADQGMNLHLLGWLSLYDMFGDPHSSGLVGTDGHEKPAYEVWKGL